MGQRKHPKNNKFPNSKKKQLKISISLFIYSYVKCCVMSVKQVCVLLHYNSYTHSHSPASLTTSTDLDLEISDFKKLELRPTSSMAHQINQINHCLHFWSTLCIKHKPLLTRSLLFLQQRWFKLHCKNVCCCRLDIFPKISAEK